MPYGPTDETAKNKHFKAGYRAGGRSVFTKQEN
jgi:hypothetical protein